MYDIITVGSATIDVFAHTDFSEIIKIKEPKHESELLAYPLGSKILINELRFTTGGGGTNTAVAFARLGHKVAWLGKLGNDANANIIIDELKKEKVDILAIKGKGYTGYSVILDSLEHDRTILAYKGVNDELKFNEIHLKKLKTKWFYFSSMLGKSFTTLERLAVHAQKSQIKIAFNPSTYLVKKGANYLNRLLSKTDILVLNDEEAGILADDSDINRQFIKLKALGPKIIVITAGKHGADAFDGKYIYKILPRNVKVVETTGAGDAFAASFLSGMIKKNNIELALKLAKTNAESVITHPGAKNQLLKYNEALAIMRQYSCKIKKTSITSL